jgi:hypothetical protein
MLEYALWFRVIGSLSNDQKSTGRWKREENERIKRRGKNGNIIGNDMDSEI